MTKAVASWLLLAAVLGACGGGEPGATDPTGPAEPRAAELAYTCGNGAFTAGALALPARDEREGHRSAAALRSFLAAPYLEADWLPDDGWRRVSRDATSAGYVAPLDADPPFASATLEMRDGVWKVTGWGQCQPQLVLSDGLGIATFRVEAAVAAAARRFPALVTERACASGRSAAGRIVGPVIVYGTDRIDVAFGVRPLPGAQTCQGNPDTPFVVELDQPVGDRPIYDASLLPPQGMRQPLP